jgi:hypothetical protein
MTEAYLLSRAKTLRTPFEFAFGTDVGFFEWLEGEEGQENPVPRGKRSRHGFISSLSRAGYGYSPLDCFLADPETNTGSKLVLALSVQLH